MIRVRRLAYVALVVAFGHIVFGAIVRISGSGMGCGENWPKCYGRWFPPLTRPDRSPGCSCAARHVASNTMMSTITGAIAHIASATGRAAGTLGDACVRRAAKVERRIMACAIAQQQSAAQNRSRAAGEPGITRAIATEKPEKKS